MNKEMADAIAEAARKRRESFKALLSRPELVDELVTGEKKEN